ncbi:MAG: lipoyl(octanoyl) transferase LipB [Gammaproteobacteria bacterium]
MKRQACKVRSLGLRPYADVLADMHAFTAERTPDTVDELWLLQHERVFTQGQAGKAEHVLNAGDIPVIQSDRGGQVTYHGPGQLIVYFLLDVRRREAGVRTLVDLIEQSLLRVLASYGIEAELRKSAPGVYVDNRKIAALGLRIRRGCSLHGLSFNIDMDLAPFARINPCGYAGLECTQLRDLLVAPAAGLFAEAEARVVGELLRALL